QDPGGHPAHHFSCVRLTYTILLYSYNAPSTAAASRGRFVMIPSARGIPSLEGAVRPVSWLWPGYLASGRLTLLDGDPGVGKSLVSLDPAARLTTGRELPDGSRPDLATAVVVLSGEDDMQDTLRPRLLAAGADLRRVHAWNSGAGLPQFPQDCGQLEEFIQ